MTRDDIIRIAKQVGIEFDPRWGTCFTGNIQLERFAALVAAAEREKVAQWMVQRSYATGHGDTTEDLLKELEWQVRESEREACAKVCEAVDEADTQYRYDYRRGVLDCADAIRARGKE